MSLLMIILAQHFYIKFLIPVIKPDSKPNNGIHLYPNGTCGSSYIKQCFCYENTKKNENNGQKNVKNEQKSTVKSKESSENEQKRNAKSKENSEKEKSNKNTKNEPKKNVKSKEKERSNKITNKKKEKQKTPHGK